MLNTSSKLKDIWMWRRWGMYLNLSRLRRLMGMPNSRCLMMKGRKLFCNHMRKFHCWIHDFGLLYKLSIVLMLLQRKSHKYHGKSDMRHQKTSSKRLMDSCKLLHLRERSSYKCYIQNLLSSIENIWCHHRWCNNFHRHLQRQFYTNIFRRWRFYWLNRKWDNLYLRDHCKSYNLNDRLRTSSNPIGIL